MTKIGIPSGRLGEYRAAPAPSATELQIDGSCCDNGRRFYAQAAVAQRDGLPAPLEGQCHLGTGEVPFGADEDGDFGLLRSFASLRPDRRESHDQRE